MEDPKSELLAIVAMRGSNVLKIMESFTISTPGTALNVQSTLAMDSQ